MRGHPLIINAPTLTKISRFVAILITTRRPCYRADTKFSIITVYPVLAFRSFGYCDSSSKYAINRYAPEHSDRVGDDVLPRKGVAKNEMSERAMANSDNPRCPVEFAKLNSVACDKSDFGNAKRRKLGETCGPAKECH